MNTFRFGRAPFRAWPIAPSRGVQTRASRPARLNPRAPPTRRQPTPDADEQPTAYKGPTMSPRLMTFLGVSVLGISTYCGFLYASYSRQVTKAQSLDVPTDVSDRYNDIASSYDAEVDMSEKIMLMGTKRANLIRLAHGDVLEVSCGTGRNLELYELGGRRTVDEQGRAALRGCRSLTFVDLSPQMVAVTKQKFEALHPEYRDVAFRAQDAGSVSVELPRRSESTGIVGNRISGLVSRSHYDTVVQTMGICSMPDPVAALRHLGSITEPTHGRILLLEHGRSHYRWLNRILDNLAPTHADRYGCWWNRDIGAIIRESGLEIVEEKRWHFGTTWRYVLRPRRSEGSK